MEKVSDGGKSRDLHDLLTVRTPTHLAWSDSCPYGLGVTSSWAEPGESEYLAQEASFYGADEANNVLELLGMAINILLLLLLLQQTDQITFPCLLALGDNTSAIAWIFKSGKVSRSSPYYLAVKMIAPGGVTVNAERGPGLRNPFLKNVWCDRNFPVPQLLPLGVASVPEQTSEQLLSQEQ